MSGHTWQVKNKDQAKAFCQWINEQQESGKEFNYSIKEMRRSDLQNAALHTMFRRMSIALNDAGFDMKSDVLIRGDLPWSEHTVKSELYKRIILHLFETDKSSELTREELTHSVDFFLDTICQKTGVTVEFSNKEKEML
jgi:hypothetical protein